MENTALLLLCFGLVFAAGAASSCFIFWLSNQRGGHKTDRAKDESLMEDILRDVPQSLKEQFENLMRYDGTKRGQKPIEKD